jgi:ribosomal protein S18 acetylase RimI-like enzyme
LVTLRVIRTHRRQGIGLRLLDLVIDRARSRGIPSFVSHVDSNSGPEAAAFLQAAGFHPVQTVTTFEGDLDLDRYEADFRPIYDRLEARGKIPADAAIVSLGEAPLDQVSRLYTNNLGDTIDGVEIFIRHGLGMGRLAATFTLMVGGRVIGLHLLDIHQSIVELHAKIVAPEYRAGWANALLTREFVRRLRESGTHRVRYSAADHVTYSLKFAKRQSIAIVNVATQFIRELGMKS